MAAVVNNSFESVGTYEAGGAVSRSLLYPAAALSLTAAMGHLWAMPHHFDEWLGYGLFFLIVALLQGLYGVALLRWPARPLLLAGIAGNLTIVGFYITTRTAGVPLLGPHAGHVEAVGAVDLISTGAELALVAVLVVMVQALPAARTYVMLGAAQAFGIGAVLHLLHGPVHGASGTAPVLHWLSYSTLALPFSVLVVWLATLLARRLVSFFEAEASGGASRLAWALAVAAASAVASVPANGLAVQHAEAGPFLAQALRDAGVVLAATFLLMFAVSALRGAPWERPKAVNLWRPRLLAASAGAVAALAVVAGPTIFGHTFSQTATAQQAPAACSAESYDRSYDVAAINVDLPFNRWGDLDPDGQVYVLQGDKEAVKNWSKPLSANPAEDPADNRRLRPRPLTLRANAGECIKVDFTNELNDRQWGGRLVNPRASMQVRGPSYDAQTSDGGAIGFNEDTTVSNTQGQNKISYFWKAPEEEGLHLFRSQTMASGEEEDAGSNAHGLYGALAVEPAGSTWLDPVSGKQLYSPDNARSAAADPSRDTSGQSGDLYIDAMIKPPGAPAFRESVQLAQDYNEVAPGEVGHGFNYGTEPQRNRVATNPQGEGTTEQLAPDSVGEETSLSSWVYGDPALVKLASGKGPWKPTPKNKSVEDCNPNNYEGFDSTSCYVANVHHAYPKDPTKIRYAMAGVAETHVFHMHAHQWLSNPKDTATFDPKNPSSATIDSQTFGPGETFTADLLYGAGSQPGTVGDSIFHCHLYPHFAEGFWSLFRVHDVTEDGSGETPDGVNVRNLQPLPETQAPPVPTADNPGYPRFIPGEVGWRAPQAPDSITEPDPTTPAPGDKREAERIVAGKRIPAGKLALEEKVQRLNYGGEEPKPGAPLTDPCTPGSREITYDVSVIQTDIVYNEAGWHDTQGRMLVLDKDAEAILAGRKDPEPLFVRVNAGDCVNFNLTNRLPNWFGNDAFQELVQTNMMGQHIHLVKFDVLGSDGASNGWNYQQAGFSREQMEFNQKVLNGEESCDWNGCRLPDPADYDPTSKSGTAPGQTIAQRWYADYELRTVFGHDHHFAAIDQNRGLFNGLLVEPEGMDFRNPKTGEFYSPINNASNGPVCGSACKGDAAGTAMDIIGPGPDDDFREFGLAIQDFVSLTREGGDPRNKADTFVPPNEPEEYPDEDPGIVGVNYRNAPFPLRQERDGASTDPAHVFSSTVHGDPQTPVLEAYANDPVQVRLLQGAHEHQHVFDVNGMRWNEDQNDPDSPLVNTQAVGISEAFNFRVPKMDCGAGASDCTGDYLYSSTNVDDLYMGMWGILRARGNSVPTLLPLPDNVPQTEVAGDVSAPAATEPPKSSSPGTPCATGASVKKFSVVALEQRLDYNEFGDHDPYGLIYALAEDEAAIRAGDKKPEPLVLRANEGDCIEVRLTNKLTSRFLEHNGAQDGDAMPPLEPETGTKAGLRVSLHPQLLKYDVRGSDGTAVGYNRDQTVGPGESTLYRWYADKELGATNLTDFGDVRGHRHHGLFAGLNIEPKGSTYHDPVTGDEIKSGVSADIRIPNARDFREFTTFFQDGLNIRDKAGVPIPNVGEPPGAPAEPAGEAHDHIDQGEKGFNYANAPFHHRLGMEPVHATETNPLDGQALSDVYSSRVHGDPKTPIFRSYAGDPVRMRVLQGADKQRQNAYQLAGHNWRSYPGDSGSPLVSTEGGFSVGRTLNAHLSSAGNGFAGDYRYSDGMYRHHLSGGMWGLMRVYPQPGAGALNPTPIGPRDDPRAGGHPILPLEITATATQLGLSASPKTVDPGGTVTLSGKLASGETSLSGKEVVLEKSPAGANKWTALEGGKLTTSETGGFELAGVKPTESTNYRARFTGNTGIGLKASTSPIAAVSVNVSQATSLALETNPATITYGKTTKVSGKLVSGDKALANKQVTLLRRPAGDAKFSRVPDGVVTTNAGGSFSKEINPEKNTAYRARFAGEPELKASTSPIKQVNVRVRISNNTTTSQLKLGQSKVVSGVVAPSHTGSVTVTVKNGTKVVAKKSVPLQDSRYRFVYKPPRAGTYTVTASFAKDADHLGNTSPAKSFKAIR
ncbi:MAG: hypothetical protein H0V53_06645 [Rubrobacter sp.]|nr:hypothetical protein [Rubrobacter sp.]